MCLYVFNIQQTAAFVLIFLFLSNSLFCQYLPICICEYRIRIVVCLTSVLHVFGHHITCRTYDLDIRFVCVCGCAIESVVYIRGVSTKLRQTEWILSCLV